MSFPNNGFNYSSQSSTTNYSNQYPIRQPSLTSAVPIGNNNQQTFNDILHRTKQNISRISQKYPSENIEPNRTE